MAEKIAIKCEQCGKQFGVPAAMAGKKAKCPCGNIVTVQPATTGAATVAGTTKWYYAKGSDRHGPVSQEEIIDLRRKGEIDDGDLVWRKGLDNWQPAADVDEINPPEPKAEEAAAQSVEEQSASAEATEEQAAEAEAEVDDRQWHYSEEGQQNGPISTPELQGLIREGEVSGAALVWTEGFENWANVTEVDAFTDLVSSDELGRQDSEQPVSATADTVVASAEQLEQQYEAEQAVMGDAAAQPATGEAVEMAPEATAVSEAAPGAGYAEQAEAISYAPTGELAPQPPTTLYASARSTGKALTVLGILAGIAMAVVGVALGLRAFDFEKMELLGIGVIAFGIALGLLSIFLFKGIGEVLKIAADIGDREAQLAAMMQRRGQ